METSVKMAEKAGVQLLIENEGNSYSGTCREARLIMEAVDSPAVQCIYHPRVTGLTGEGPIRGLQSGPRVHLARPHGPTGLPLGRQRADHPHRECVNALVADGYDGWITIERHFHPRDPEKMPSCVSNRSATSRPSSSCSPRRKRPSRDRALGEPHDEAGGCHRCPTKTAR